jgi:hypothetical protein
MKLNAPTKLVWYIALILGIVGIILKLAGIAPLNLDGLWLTAVAWVLLVLATVLKGM